MDKFMKYFLFMLILLFGLSIIVINISPTYFPNYIDRDNILLVTLIMIIFGSFAGLGMWLKR